MTLWFAKLVGLVIALISLAVALEITPEVTSEKHSGHSEKKPETYPPNNPPAFPKIIPETRPKKPDDALPTTNSLPACAQIAELYAKWHQGGETGWLVGLPGNIAFECLRSTPFRQELALKFLDEYWGYLQFHSTLDTLKEPGPGYVSTRVDLMKGYDWIRRKVVTNKYTNHYDFDQDLNYVLSRANDGHLVLELCSQTIFQFERGVPLVSISEDGLHVPLIYTYADAAAKLRGDTNVSPVHLINGDGAEYWLQANIATKLNYQDPDARYNDLFPSHVAGFTGHGAGGSFTSRMGQWPDTAETILTFANGTTQIVKTTASWSFRNGPMTYSSGEALFDAACLPSLSGHFGSYTGSFPRKHTFHVSTGAESFPKPFIRHNDDHLRGYYLIHKDITDVAVLQIPTFRLTKGQTSFSHATRAFMEKALHDGKSKLIIDLSGNPGGDVNEGLDLFRAFFPDKPIYSATRFRATELIFLLGKVFSASASQKKLADFDLDPHINAHKAVTPNQAQGFASWQDLFGPEIIGGSRMSRLYSVFNVTAASTSESPISGYGGAVLNPYRQAFKTENIIIMTDGRCASTCVTFAQLMRGQGVRSIAFGGRPREAGMTALGGIRGAQHWTLSLISSYLSAARQLLSSFPKLLLTEEETSLFEQLAPPSLANMSLVVDRYGNSGINFRNAYAEGDDETPLQFVYEAADCRLFYTAENVVVPHTAWDAAARAMFLGAACVHGSVNATGPSHHESGRPG